MNFRPAVFGLYSVSRIESLGSQRNLILKLKHSDVICRIWKLIVFSNLDIRCPARMDTCIFLSPPQKWLHSRCSSVFTCRLLTCTCVVCGVWSLMILDTRQSHIVPDSRSSVEKARISLDLLILHVGCYSGSEMIKVADIQGLRLTNLAIIYAFKVG